MFAWLKPVLQWLDPATLKALGEARNPEAGGAVEDDADRMDRPYPTSNALVPMNAVMLREYPALAWSSKPAHYDTSTAMETAVSDLSLDRVNTLHSIAITALIIGALASIIATIILVWTTDIKSRFANARLANAMAQSDQAKAEAARANERTATLLRQTQQTLLEQDKGRHERAQVGALNAWRRISAVQHDKMVKALRGHAVIVSVLSAGNDPESEQFAEDIVKTLKDAGATVNAATSVFPIPMRGLGMTMTHSDAGTALYAALKGTGFEIKDLPEKDPMMIVVGTKP
jgi:hypothetical protein